MNHGSATIIYVDGFNLYYGALKGTGCRWLDLDRLFSALFPRNDIVAIRYFTAPINALPSDPEPEAHASRPGAGPHASNRSPPSFVTGSATAPSPPASFPQPSPTGAAASPNRSLGKPCTSDLPTFQPSNLQTSTIAPKRVTSHKHTSATRPHIPSKEEAGYEPPAEGAAAFPKNPVVHRGQDHDVIV